MRDEKELQKLYKDCMDFWGFEAQAKIMQEECAELILAIFHLFRKRKGAASNTMEEIADVYLMLQQMMFYFDKEAIMEIVHQKSDRVKAKLERYKKEN